MNQLIELIFVFILAISVVSGEDEFFVTTKGVNFMLNGSTFFANGFNSYWLMYKASFLEKRPNISNMFEAAKAASLTLARTWAFSDGVPDRPLQYSPGSYDEQMFQTILTRVNSFSGIVYKDDPTIMAWELMNEPRCFTDISGKSVESWVTEMTSLSEIDRLKAPPPPSWFRRFLWTFNP